MCSIDYYNPGMVLALSCRVRSLGTTTVFRITRLNLESHG